MADPDLDSGLEQKFPKIFSNLSYTMIYTLLWWGRLWCMCTLLFFQSSC